MLFDSYKITNHFDSRITDISGHWVVPEKDPHSSHRENACRPQGDGRKNCF